VTGAAGGIGLGVGAAFLKAGANVTLHYHSDSKTLQPLLQQYSNKAQAVSADATKEESVAQCVKQAASSKFGPVAILIANHGIFPSKDVDVVDMSLEQFQNTIAVNLTGIFLFCREYLRQLKGYCAGLSKQALQELNANIVIISSTAAKFGEAGHADYAASKSALSYGFTRSLKNEIVRIAPRGRVNCVAPGWTRTAMAEESIRAGQHYKALQSIPLKKIASVEDCSNAILVLASAQLSGHTSGAVFEVDGGMEGRVLNSLDDIKAAEKGS